MTKRNRLKKEAHDIAAKLWEWDDKRSRSRMYTWLHNHRKEFNGRYHIREMDEGELRHLINLLRIKVNLKVSNQKPLKIKKKNNVTQQT